MSETKTVKRAAFWKHVGTGCGKVVRDAVEIQVTTVTLTAFPWTRRTERWLSQARECECGKLLHATVIKCRKTETKCGARCLASTGPSCECSCGGANHGNNHAA